MGGKGTKTGNRNEKRNELLCSWKMDGWKMERDILSTPARFARIGHDHYITKNQGAEIPRFGVEPTSK